MIIEPANIDNPEELMKEVLKWRKTPHGYEDPKPFEDKGGNMVRHLFCGKCGLSKQNSIHI